MEGSLLPYLLILALGDNGELVLGDLGGSFPIASYRSCPTSFQASVTKSVSSISLRRFLTSVRSPDCIRMPLRMPLVNARFIAVMLMCHTILLNYENLVGLCQPARASLEVSSCGVPS
jgi:hypothetical protein